MIGKVATKPPCKKLRASACRPGAADSHGWYADQKQSVRNPPDSATLTSSTDDSEGFSQNSLPSHTAYAIIAGTRC